VTLLERAHSLSDDQCFAAVFFSKTLKTSAHVVRKTITRGGKILLKL